MSFSCRLPRILSILSCILKPDRLEGAFQNRQYGFFFIPVNGCSWGTKVFMINEIFRKKWSKQKLGTKYKRQSVGNSVWSLRNGWLMQCVLLRCLAFFSSLSIHYFRWWKYVCICMIWKKNCAFFVLVHPLFLLFTICYLLTKFECQVSSYKQDTEFCSQVYVCTRFCSYRF